MFYTIQSLEKYDMKYSGLELQSLFLDIKQFIISQKQLEWLKDIESKSYDNCKVCLFCVVVLEL